MVGLMHRTLGHALPCGSHRARTTQWENRFPIRPCRQAFHRKINRKTISSAKSWDGEDGASLDPEDVARQLRSRVAASKQASSSSSDANDEERKGFEEMMRAGAFSGLYATADVHGALRRAMNSGEVSHDAMRTIEMLPGTQRCILYAHE